MRWLRGLGAVVFAVGLAAGLAAGVARAAQGPSVLARILARGTIRVGMTGDYRPFDLRDPRDGVYRGLDVDMARGLARSLGVRLEIVPTTWPTLMAGLLAHRYDIAMGGITITLPRLRTAFFSHPVLRAGKVPLTLCKNAARFATLAEIDRPGVKVIVNPGGTNAAFDRAHLHHAQIVVIPDNTKTFGEILAGRVDLMITDNVEAELQHKLHPALCAVHPGHPFDFAELGYMMPQDPALRSYVDEWLRITRKTGLYGRLRRRWMQ